MSNNKVAKVQRKRAEKLLKLGKLADSKIAYFECCKLNPNDGQAWFSAGQVSSRLNHFQDASVAFQRALGLNPNMAEIYFELAQAQSSLGQYLEAEQNYRSFLMMSPSSGEGYHAYAKLLHTTGRISDATNNYRKASELLTNNASLYLEFGSILQKQGLSDEALEQYLKAQKLKPEFVDVYYHLANHYRDIRQLDLALVNYNKAFELAPGDEAIHHYYLGTLSEAKQNTIDALSHYNRAIKLNQNLPEVHLSKALCLLYTGQFAEGWVEYEWRLKCPDWLRQRRLNTLKTPVWDGGSYPDKAILVIAEQGYGDTFQFCRYLSLLAENFSKVVVYCKPEVASLIQSVDGVDEVVLTTQEISVERFDSYVYMMSLPYLFKTTLDTIPNQSPYIHAPKQLKPELDKCLAGDGLKVGLAWSGSPSNSKNTIRNIPLSDLAPLGNISGIRFFGIQKGPGSEQASSPPENMDFTDLSHLINDFSDTAAVISKLDLVISVDSAVAHLAGALGIPVWVFIYMPPDWRYLIGREDSPWYSSMRLFRQDDSRDWQPVIKQVEEKLIELSSVL